MDGGLRGRKEYTVAFWRKSYFLTVVKGEGQTDGFLAVYLTGWRNRWMSARRVNVWIPGWMDEWTDGPGWWGATDRLRDLGKVANVEYGQDGWRDGQIDGWRDGW